jgi:hypothetical protein
LTPTCITTGPGQTSQLMMCWRAYSLAAMRAIVIPADGTGVSQPCRRLDEAGVQVVRSTAAGRTTPTGFGTSHHHGAKQVARAHAVLRGGSTFTTVPPTPRRGGPAPDGFGGRAETYVCMWMMWWTCCWPPTPRWVKAMRLGARKIERVEQLLKKTIPGLMGGTHCRPS